jgi:hypothetical protein
VATDSSSQKPSKGVHTYRGRTLQDLLPRIHAELGTDAVIVDERERFLDDVSGFSAQSFVEVDARRHDGPPICAGRAAPSADLNDQSQHRDGEPAVTRPEAMPVAQPTQPVARIPTPTARRFETAVFMNRLRQASAVAPDDAAGRSGTEQPAADPAIGVQAPLVDSQREQPPRPTPVAQPEGRRSPSPSRSRRRDQGLWSAPSGHRRPGR